MKTVFFSAAAVAAVFGATAAQAADTVSYNDTPADTWFYGDGNDYAPANSTVLTTEAGNQLSLRFHETFETAPASVGNLYTFALGTNPLSFDWGIDAGDDLADLAGITALLTLTNIGTGVSSSYDPFFVGNDNEYAGGSAQNSNRLRWDPWGWNPIGFDPNVDNTYRVQLDVFGLAGGDKSLFVDAQVGAGAPAVPEPATWAMMLLGMGLVGAAMRRKAKVSVRVRYA